MVPEYAGKWAVSLDEDSWSLERVYESRNRAVAEGPSDAGFPRGSVFFVGQVRLVEAGALDVYDPCLLIEAMADVIRDEAGELSASTFLSAVTLIQEHDLERRLRATLLGWMRAHAIPTEYHVIDDIERLTVMPVLRVVQ